MCQKKKLFLPLSTSFLKYFFICLSGQVASAVGKEVVIRDFWVEKQNETLNASVGKLNSPILYNRTLDRYITFLPPPTPVLDVEDADMLIGSLYLRSEAPQERCLTAAANPNTNLSHSSPPTANQNRTVNMFRTELGPDFLNKFTAQL